MIAFVVHYDEDTQAMWVEEPQLGQTSPKVDTYRMSHTERADAIRRGVADIFRQQTGLDDV